MKKNLFSFWVLLLAVFISASSNAQVTLGNSKGAKTAEAFSALEVISNGKGGLRLPQLTTDQRNTLSLAAISDPTKKILANGLTILNTTTNCVEYWNNKRWISLCEGTSQTTVSPAPCVDVAADGTGCDSQITVTDPDCPNGPFKMAILAGSEYAALTDVSETNGTFKIAFNENNSVTSRSVIVRVTSTCTGQYKDFVYMQNGVDCGKFNYTVPTLSSSPTGSPLNLCSGGAVYLSVPVTTANLDKLIWTCNGVEVARGVSYYVATKSGTYNISMGAAGCNTNTANERIIKDSGTAAPDAVKTISASNNGVLCDTSGNVTLTALNATGAVSWFHNGVLSSKTGTSITLNGSGDAGDWFAAAGSGCYAKPSNTVNIVYQVSAGTPIVLNNSDILINDTPIDTFNKFCQGGSLELKVNNKKPNVTYTWYNGNVVITSPYVIPAGQASILLNLIATDNSGVACPVQASSTEKQIQGSVAPSAPSITGKSAVCGAGTTLSALPGTGYTYKWFKDGVVTGDSSNQLVVTSGGSYTVTLIDPSGCVSAPSTPKVIAAAPSDTPVLTWTPEINTANFGDIKVFGTSITYGPATSYNWTTTGTLIAGQGTAGATVSFPTGTPSPATVTVTATNECSSVTMTQSVVITSACKDATTVSITPSDISISTTESTSFTATSNATGTPVYHWYYSSTNSNSTIGATNIPGTFNAVSFNKSAAGTYYVFCTVQSGCGGAIIASSTSKVTVVDFSAYNTVDATLSMSGKVCFDTKETFDVNNNGSVAIRTESASPTPTGTWDYVVTSTGNIASVIWQASCVQDFYTSKVVSAAPNAKYSLTFKDLGVIKSMVDNSAKADADQIITITAYVTYSDGKQAKISKVVKIQDFVCCDGFVCVGCAYDYSVFATVGTAAPNTAGDWSRTSVVNGADTPQNPGVVNTDDIRGSWNSNGSDKYTMTNFFSAAPVGDLCVYKKDAATASSTTTWFKFYNACQSGSGADGEKGWYLPNLKELSKIYLALPGTNGGAKLGTTQTWGNASDAAPLLGDMYFSSTEGSDYYVQTLNFSSGNRGQAIRSIFNGRCVRRM